MSKGKHALRKKAKKEALRAPKNEQILDTEKVENEASENENSESEKSENEASENENSESEKSEIEKVENKKSKGFFNVNKNNTNNKKNK